MVDPLSDKTNTCKRKQPVKLLSVEGLKKALRFVIVSIGKKNIKASFDYEAIQQCSLVANDTTPSHLVNYIKPSPSRNQRT